MTGISEAFASGLIFPAMVLAFLGWAVPRLNALWLPEGVRPLMINALLSTLMMGVLGAGYFGLLYLWQGMPFDTLFEAGLGHGALHFLRVSMMSALLWAPILLFSLSRLPRKWVKEVW